MTGITTLTKLITADPERKLPGSLIKTAATLANKLYTAAGWYDLDTWTLAVDDEFKYRYGYMSVIDDYDRYKALVTNILTERAPIYERLAETVKPDIYDPSQTYGETVTEEYGGKDETDSTSTATGTGAGNEKRGTYESDTLHPTGSTDSTTETNSTGKDTTTYGKTLSRTREGFILRDQIELTERQREIADFSIFRMQIDDIVNAIGVPIYLTPYEMEESQ